MKKEERGKRKGTQEGRNQLCNEDAGMPAEWCRCASGLWVRSPQLLKSDVINYTKWGHLGHLAENHQAREWRLGQRRETNSLSEGEAALSPAHTLWPLLWTPPTISKISDSLIITEQVKCRIKNLSIGNSFCLSWPGAGVDWRNNGRSAWQREVTDITEGSLWEKVTEILRNPFYLFYR